MTIWQRIKHGLGFHGDEKDNEWLDGRIGIDWAKRTYHCNTCGAIYEILEVLPDGENRYELDRLRMKRDADRKALKRYLDTLN